MIKPLINMEYTDSIVQVTSAEIVGAVLKLFGHDQIHQDAPTNRELNRTVRRIVKSGLTQHLDNMLKTIAFHPEGEGKFCDTGEDMEWACRSECVKRIMERLQ